VWRFLALQGEEHIRGPDIDQKRKIREFASAEQLQSRAAVQIGLQPVGMDSWPLASGEATRRTGLWTKATP
jgi:hypothetical protein